MPSACRSLRTAVFLIGLAGLFVLCMDRGRANPSSSPQQPGVELKTIKYQGLLEAVKTQRGKVVVVDIWGFFCQPCKEAFPHLVELQRKYRDKGLVCVSVSVDPPKFKEKALKFLIDQQADFPNFWLDEEIEVWVDRLQIISPPAVFVFNREGRRAGKFAPPEKHEDVEKLVKQLLEAQP